MSKFLSLDWFKNKVETTIEKVVTNKLEALMEQEDVPTEKLILNIKLVNDVLTVVLTNGDLLFKQEADKDDYDLIINAKSVEEIKEWFNENCSCKYFIYATDGQDYNIPIDFVSSTLSKIKKLEDTIKSFKTSGIELSKPVIKKDDFVKFEEVS